MARSQVDIMEPLSTQEAICRTNQIVPHTVFFPISLHFIPLWNLSNLIQAPHHEDVKTLEQMQIKIIGLVQWIKD